MSKPGQTLGGKYELLELAGEGGMATVWKGRTHGAKGFTRPIAIKRIHDPVAMDPDFLAMFVEEARVVSELRHPNIVQIHDFGIDRSGAYYIIMEWVEGIDLRSWSIAHQTIGEETPWHLVMAIGIEILKALASAHERVDQNGRAAPIFHRDVTPANILLDINGIAKLSDFGLARAMDRARMTKPMVVKGKLTYLAPEQSLGQDPTVQSDLFTMGIVLWEVLAGRKLYDANNPVDIMRQVRDAQVPDLSLLRPDVPSGVVAIIERALRPEPKNRFDSARSMARALASLLRSLPKSTDPLVLGRSVSFAREVLLGRVQIARGEKTESLVLDELIEVDDPRSMTHPVRKKP